MKILVDEMPSIPKECIFSECTNRLTGSYVCKLWQGRGCSVDTCDFLKPLANGRLHVAVTPCIISTGKKS